MALNFSALQPKKEEENARQQISNLPGINLGSTANSSQSYMEAEPIGGKTLILSALKGDLLRNIRGDDRDQFQSYPLPEGFPKQETISAPTENNIANTLRRVLPQSVADAVLGTGMEIAAGDPIIPGVIAEQNRSDTGAVGFFYESLTKSDQRKYDELVQAFTEKGIDKTRAAQVASGQVRDFTEQEKDIIASIDATDFVFKTLESLDFMPAFGLLTKSGRKLNTKALQRGAKGIETAQKETRQVADNLNVSSLKSTTRAGDINTKSLTPESVAADMAPEDITIVSDLADGKFINPIEKKQILRDFGLTKASDTEVQRFFDDVRTELNIRWGGVDEAANTARTRPGALDIKPVDRTPEYLRNNKQAGFADFFAPRKADEVPNVPKVPKVRQMSRSQEVPSLLRTAEQEGMFPTQKAGITMESLGKKEVVLALREEAMVSNPARQLSRFANKNGELPEVLGGAGKGKFAKEGDQIVADLGFDSSEEARDAYAKYLKQREDVLSLRDEVRNDRKILREQNKVMPREFKLLTGEQKQTIIDGFNDAKQGGTTEKVIESLRKKGMTQRDIEAIVLPNGEYLVDTVKVKKEANGVFSAVVTQRDLDTIEKNFRGTRLDQKWIPTKTAMQKVKAAGRKGKQVALDYSVHYYELPQLFFDRTGLREHFYDPVREARRNASKQKTKIYDRFVEAGLMKEQGWFTADRFTLSKKESENVARYYLERQGKGGGINLEDLSDKELSFVRLFDDVIKETEGRFYYVAKLNGKEPGKVHNYAPLMTSDDFKLAQEVSDMDFIYRKHPSFFSLKQREELVPFEMYELDYRKVAVRWIDQITNFNHVGEVGPQVKYLAQADEFKDIVGDQVFQTTNKWLQDVFNPQVLTPAENGVRFFRHAQSIASLGLNFGSVIKQILSVIPISIIEKAPPKFTSRFARDFGIDVSKLPSITERKGNAAIMDMQEGLKKVAVGPLTRMDQKVATTELKGLLDKEYRALLKQGKEITPEMQAMVLKKAQDALDVWMGGMTPEQLPKAFRSELGKALNMFIMPLTSQLNGFFYAVAKAKGIKKAEKLAEVMTAAVAIAYMEQVMTNLSPDWTDKEDMLVDIGSSLAGNIPIISQIIFAVRTDQPLSPSPVLSAVSRMIQQISKYTDDQAEEVDVAFAIAELFGVPKQFRRTTQGVEVIIEGGVRDKDGKLLAPVKGSDEYMRALIRGKYGTIAAQDWIRNVGVASEQRRWHVPEVEFLQNGDYDRKAELYRTFDQATKDDLYNELSETQQKKLDKALAGENNANGKRSLESIFGGGQQRSLEEIFAE